MNTQGKKWTVRGLYSTKAPGTNDLRGGLILALLITLATWASPGYGHETADPLESINRVTMQFNEAVDTVVLRPAAKAYDNVVPPAGKSMIGNFFSNLGEIPNALNNVMQFKFGQAAKDLGRFTVNTTVGVAGLFEVAEPALGLERSNQDFGRTLAHWGVGAGPYVVLPILGPSTLRDGFGRGVDFIVDPVSNIAHTPTEVTMQAGRAVDTRSDYLLFDELVMGDEYLFVREAYLQRRAAQLGEFEDGGMAIAFEDF